MTTRQYDISQLGVLIGIPVNRAMEYQVVGSLLATQLQLLRRSIRHGFSFQAGGSIVESARTGVVHEFLTNPDYKDYDRLFWIDSDIVWEAEQFLRMLALSTAMQVVVAPYPAKQDPPEIRLNADTGVDVEMNEHGCLPLDGMGMGFCIMHREVLVRLAERAPSLRFPDGADKRHLFRCDTVRGKHDGLDYFRGEDNAFFADVQELGYTVWIDPSCNVGHIGTKVYRANLMDMLRQAP